MRMEPTNVQRLDEFGMEYLAEVSRRTELSRGIVAVGDQVGVSISNLKIHHMVASGEVTLRVSDLAAMLGVQVGEHR